MVKELSLVDLYWVAGFLEGEGWFSRCGGTIAAQASQVQKWPLEKLYKLLGGSLLPRKAHRMNANDYFTWSLFGTKAEELMKAIFPIMSSKRQNQITLALTWYASRPGRNFVKSGRTKWRKCNHPYTPENTYVFPKRGLRTCKTCKLEYQRKFYRDSKAATIVNRLTQYQNT